MSQIACIQFCLEQFLIIAQTDLIFRRVYTINEDRFTKGNTKAFSLTNSIVDQTFVFAHNFAIHIYKIAWFAFITAFSLDKSRIVAIRDKTDVLAIPFFRNKTVDFFRNFTNFVLRIIANGQQHCLQLFLCQSV